jgi:hypothetical protein
MREKFPTHCARCAAELRTCTMSRFNTDTICHDCREDEKQAPGYAEAERREVEAVRAGFYNFPGVGLSVADLAFLGERLRARKAAR